MRLLSSARAVSDRLATARTRLAGVACELEQLRSEVLEDRGCCETKRACQVDRDLGNHYLTARRLDGVHRGRLTEVHAGSLRDLRGISPADQPALDAVYIDWREPTASRGPRLTDEAEVPLLRGRSGSLSEGLA